MYPLDERAGSVHDLRAFFPKRPVNVPADTVRADYHRLSRRDLVKRDRLTAAPFKLLDDIAIMDNRT